MATIFKQYCFSVMSSSVIMFHHSCKGLMWKQLSAYVSFSLIPWSQIYLLKGTFCCLLVKNVVLHSVHLSSLYWPLLYKQVSGFSGLLHLAALASENGNDCWRYRKIKQQSVPFIVPLSASLKICLLIWFCHWLFLMILFCFFLFCFCLFFLPLCLKPSWSHYVSIS